MGNNRFMVVSEEKDIIVMNPSYVEQTGIQNRRKRKNCFC